MKLGVHIGYWGLGLSSEDQLEIVQEAEARVRDKAPVVVQPLQQESVPAK